jgi:UDP-N-acetylmuramoylalanine--D-glutamate ligase
MTAMLAMKRTPAADPAMPPEVLVLGMGVTGAACARYFSARGVGAAFADTRANPPGLGEIRNVMPAAPLQTGDTDINLPDSVQRLIVSPGVDLHLSVLDRARSRGLTLQSDLDLFAAEAKAPAIGITGSNGKSTVTTLVGELLRAAGRRVAVGANLGVPALDLLGNAVSNYVLELSSFQLERSAPLPLSAAVVLNVAPDHLDKHGTMQAYGAAKARIYQRCQLAVVNRDEAGLGAMVPSNVPVLGFGLTVPGDGEFGLRTESGTDHLAFGRELVLPVAQLRLEGRHNVSNALAALALCHAAGVSLDATLPALKEFRGLPHRAQRVPTLDGITWIDDSKATNVAAAVASIAGVSGPLILIAGGEGKGQSFEELALALQGRSASAVLIGKDGDLIAKALGGACHIEMAHSMDEAVAIARTLARPGHTVLLAPACSSLDMFSNYEHRGMAFAAAVKGTAQ